MTTTMLIVDDDSEMLSRLDKYFSDKGYRVISATYGKDAIEKTNKEHPDVVLLNSRLSDIDGYEVCRQIRRNWRTSWTPIIFLTEHKDREDRISGLRSGATDYLTKPFDIQELWLRVRNTLTRAKFSNLLDPITALPGERLLNQQLEELSKREAWAVCLLTVAGLDAFSERYGFVARNEVLRAAALLLGKVVTEFGGAEDFISDIGDGSFVVITSPEAIGLLQTNLIVQLESTLLHFYPLADLEDTPGNPKGLPGIYKEIVPKISLSIGSVSNNNNNFGQTKDILATARAQQKVAATIPQ